jgi:hypothetical protein
LSSAERAEVDEYGGTASVMHNDAVFIKLRYVLNKAVWTVEKVRMLIAAAIHRIIHALAAMVHRSF